MLLPPELAAALLSHPHRELVFSHASAARLYGLPTPLDGWGAPHFTASSGSTRLRGGVHIRVAPLPAGHVFTFRGVQITHPARTVLDCLRTLPPRDGLAILDSALHRKLVTIKRVLTAMQLQQGWPGVTRAREIIMLGDGRRETPLESWTAWGFHLTDLPRPQWQVEIRSAEGTFLGRVDAWWHGVAGEADGRSKYALAAAERGGQDAARVFEVLDAERKREKGLRDAGAEVVRWSAADLLNEYRLRDLAARVRQAIAEAADRDRFTGIATPVMLPLTAVERTSATTHPRPTGA